MKSNQSFSHKNTPFRILLADDDEDDHFFFEEALDACDFNKELTIFDDGEKLLTYLFEQKSLPDVLFLDYNLPRKNGGECLIAIKKHPILKDLPVIMYSTYLQDNIIEDLYREGAFFFVRKTDTKSLEKILIKVFTLLSVKKTVRPERTGFVITA